MYGGRKFSPSEVVDMDGRAGVDYSAFAGRGAGPPAEKGVGFLGMARGGVPK